MGANNMKKFIQTIKGFFAKPNVNRCTFCGDVKSKSDIEYLAYKSSVERSLENRDYKIGFVDGYNARTKG